MLNRVLTLDYKVPNYVSEAGRDLLKGLLTNRPEERLTVSKVMHHPWYMEGLPPSALNMNDIYLKNKSEASSQSIKEAARIVDIATRCPMPGIAEPVPSETEDDMIDKVILEEEHGELKQ